ncbi:MAG: 5-(carboxyamino)imidazole ribonucleotide mutase [Candidatus Thermoplasmatota archaeon]|nr:5-(carboxyamino)imidazole ribonucleotide mutase [Candidatus Thermoplasmatota archaeon]
MTKEEDHLGGGKHLYPIDECSVHIIMGSKSDMEIARKAAHVLEEFEVPYSITVASAHRTPELVESSVKGSTAKVFIAIAGLSAALPGVVASHTQMPVIGVPVSGKVNLDSILSIVQMPPGVPVACVGLDRGDNAALLAVRVLATWDSSYSARLSEYLRKMRENVYRSNEEVLGR